MLCCNTVPKAASRRVYLATVPESNSAWSQSRDGRQLERHLGAHIRNSKQEVGRTNWEWRVAFESWPCPRWHTSPARPCILILPKKHHKLESESSNSLDDGGHLDSDHHSTSVSRKCAIWVKKKFKSLFLLSCLIKS